MEQRYEPANPLSMPFECFEFDSSVNPFPVKDHCHYFAEAILGIDGTLQVTRGAETHVIQPGELLVIPPLMHHSITSADGKTVHYGVIKHDLSQHDDTLGYAPHPRSLMLENYPILKKRPFLYPFVWVYRLVHGFFFKHKKFMFQLKSAFREKKE